MCVCPVCVSHALHMLLSTSGGSSGFLVLLTVPDAFTEERRASAASPFHLLLWGFCLWVLTWPCIILRGTCRLGLGTKSPTCHACALHCAPPAQHSLLSPGQCRADAAEPRLCLRKQWPQHPKIQDRTPASNTLQEKGSASKASPAAAGLCLPVSRFSWVWGCSCPVVPALGSAGLGAEWVAPSRHMEGNNPVRNACLSWLPDKGQSLSC